MQKLDPKAVWLFFINGVLGWFFFLAIIGFLKVLLPFNQQYASYGIEYSVSDIVSGTLLFVLKFLPFVTVLVFIISKLTYHFYKYELREDGFRKEYGIIWKKYVTIPYDRIQNVDIYRGILARILGLSDIHIQTAGMSASLGRYGAQGVGTEGRLPALSKEEAERIRDELIRRARAYKNQGP